MLCAGFQAQFGTHCPLILGSAASSPQSRGTWVDEPLQCNPLRPSDGTCSCETLEWFQALVGKSEPLSDARTHPTCMYISSPCIFDHCMVSAGGCVPDFRDKRPEQNKSVFCSCLYCYSFLQKRRNNNSFGCLMLLSVKGLLEQHAAWLYPKD